VLLRATVVSMVPAAPLPEVDPVRLPVAQRAGPLEVVDVDEEADEDSEVVVVDDRPVVAGVLVVEGDDDPEEQAPSATPPSATRAIVPTAPRATPRSRPFIHASVLVLGGGALARLRAYHAARGGHRHRSSGLGRPAQP
jgi:hypothetical protein